MKIKTLVCALCATTVLGSCSFDDGELWNAVNSQEERLSVLEKWQKSVEAQLGALQGIISATDYVTGVEAVEKDGVKGYKISFLHAQPITLYYNEGGEISGSSSVGVAQEEGTNKYYWTMDGEPLMVDGKKVYVSGNDAVSMKPNAENPEIFDLTIGDYTVTVDQNAVGAHPIKGVEEKDGKVIITLNDNTKKELVKYIDFDKYFLPEYSNAAGQQMAHKIVLPEGFIMRMLDDAPAEWKMSVTGKGAATTINVTYPSAGTATIAFIISDGKSLSIVKELTFKVGASAEDTWITIDYQGEGTAIVVPEGTVNVKITGTTKGNNPYFSDYVCTPLKRCKTLKNIDLSELQHPIAIPSNAFYMNDKTGADTDYNKTIETIILPKSFNCAIFGNAFKNCQALKWVKILVDKAPAGNTGADLFTGCTALEHIYVHANQVEAFKNFDKYASVKDKIEALPVE